MEDAAIQDVGIVDPSDAASYQTFLTLDPHEDVIGGALTQLSSWLRERHWDPPLDETGFQTNGDRELYTIHHESAQGQTFRARLTEASGLGEWRTQLTVHSPRAADPWLTVRVTNDQGRWVDVPRLARYLMDSLVTLDGEIELRSDVRVVDSNSIEDLMEQITGAGRQGLFLVAATSDGEHDVKAVTEQVQRWTRQVVGLAQVAVLTPEATQTMREAFGASHAVRPGTVRTFYPDVDPAVASDGLRHKFITERRLDSDTDAATERLFGRIARRHAASRTPPPTFLKVDRTLARLQDQLLVQALTAPSATSSPTTAADETGVTEARPGVSPVGDHVALDPAGRWARERQIMQALQIDDLSDETLSRLAGELRQAASRQEALDRLSRELDKRRLQVQTFRDQADYFKDLWEEEQLDERIAANEALRLQDENRWLREQLLQANQHEAAYGVAPSAAFTTFPTDFSDLAQRLPELVDLGVEFTVDTGPMLGLDEHDTLNKLVTVAWDALLVLADYVRARATDQCHMGVQQYLNDTPTGFRNLPPKKFAARETAATMQAWGSQREFAVPEHVDSSGRATMEAHFKLGRVGMVSPRLYYLDCWSAHNRVYVGYIGPHLRNTQTN